MAAAKGYTMHCWKLLPVLAAMLSMGSLLAGDWPTVHHDNARSGRTGEAVLPPYRLAWVAEFPREIVATRVEPIVAEGKVFVGTQNGTLWALDRLTGAVRWKYRASGPILHSPAYADGRVFVGDAGGGFSSLLADRGLEIWKGRSRRGGFAAAPLVQDGVVYIGSRDGTLYAVSAETGELRWEFQTGGPIRCTAAAAGTTIVFASDDMHAYAVEAATGKQVWKSVKLFGQSARDYFPVIAGDKVVLRTVCVEEMNDELNGGTQFLQRQAGVAGGWKELEEFFQSDASRGTPELIAAEQRAILRRLEENPYRRTCFVLDLASGRELPRPPVLYAAGNQGCGFPPVLTNDGRPIIFYRTVYSNWNRGVKPAVGLGFLDLAANSIEPIRHSGGNTPPWNTFWGTCDESQAFSVGGDVLYICHQGTLSGLDLKTLRLFKIHGERDTWGGLETPIWAANEWHGPARGACAISDGQLFWITGSRVLCIEHGEAPSANPPATEWSWDAPAPVAGQPLATDRLITETRHVRPNPAAPTGHLRQQLAAEVTELLDGRPWAPLYLQMGIGSRDFYFAHPSFEVHALAQAIPYLEPPLAERAKGTARSLVAECLKPEALPLDRGRRRELFDVPPHDLTWSYRPDWPAISHVHAVWLYGERTGDWEAVATLWPAIKQNWTDYAQKPLEVESSPGHLWLNRTAMGLLAIARLARRLADEDVAAAATREFERLVDAGIGLTRLKAATAIRTLRQPTSRGDLSGNQARFLYVPLNNHKSKLGWSMDLSPEIARAYSADAPAEVETLRQFTELLMPAFYLAAEERQTHYGENFIDLPDSMHGLFLAHAYLWRTKPETLDAMTDLPWCKADLFHIEKLVLAIEAHGAATWK
jgi:outer membrane protein assembly factor BamB